MSALVSHAEAQQIDRDRLRELAENATPGPWEVNLDGDLQGRRPGRAVDLELDPMVGVLERDEDTAYIAAADPATVTALLDALDAAEAAVQRVREMHAQSFIAAFDGVLLCRECGMPSPCATRCALDGDA